MKKIIRITTIPSSMRVLLKEQLKFMSQFYEVIAVSSDDACFDAMLEEQGGIRGVRIEMTRKITPIKDFIALLKLIRFFIKEKPDIVHTHTPKAGLLGMLAAWITGVPNRYHTVAGLPLMVASGSKRKLLNFIERLTNFCATKVYPNSFAMMDFMVKEKLANPLKMKVLGNGSSNGIDVSYFNPELFIDKRSSIRAEIGLQSDDFVFIFVGRVVKDKGVEELVEAFKKFSLNNVKLLIVGEYEKDLDSISESSEIFISNNPNVKYVGYRNDVRPYMISADVLVFPSHREGFPNVVMQAGAMGLPAIVSDINGCNEIIKNNINGIIVPPYDSEALYKAMSLFVMNNNQVLCMKANAHAMIVDRYDRQIIWNALLEEYKNSK